MKLLVIITFVVKLKKPTRVKHKQWVEDQLEYTKCLNWCIQEVYRGEKLSSKDVPFNLMSCIKNEAIRRAKKAVSDYRKGNAKNLPVFKGYQSISINNQNWDTQTKNEGGT